MAELRAGLIDSGVGPADPGRIVRQRMFRAAEDGGVSETDATADLLGHGSALAEILLAADPRCTLLIAQVFRDRLSCSAAQAAAALSWLVREGARLVNMSFGLRTDRPVLRAACQQAVAQGVILVAASPARGEPVYPAAYPGVIRATGDSRCSPGELSLLATAQADFGGHVRATAGSVAGASVGCANVSAAALQFIANHPGAGQEAVRSWLASQASYRGPERRVC